MAKMGHKLRCLITERDKTGGRRLKRNLKTQADGLSLGWSRGGAGDDPDRGLGRGKDRRGWADGGAGRPELRLFVPDSRSSLFTLSGVRRPLRLEHRYSRLPRA